MTDFSAKDSGLGYFFQARYALWELLEGPEERELVLETLDDIVFETSGTAEELLQMKHHSKAANLTDSSPELWKTIRIWSALLVEKKIKIPPTRLTLVTTATAPAKSIASKLRPNRERNCDEISEALLKIASKSSNDSLEKAFEAFSLLDENQRKLLVGAIDILDGSPDISDTADKIRDRLRTAVDRQHRESLFERLEGWWFGKVVNQLRSDSPAAISGFELADKVRSIAEQFLPDSLPIDFLEAKPGSLDAKGDERGFVKQLRSIDVGINRIEKAILDYYRAYEQRSRWAREELLIGDEVERYEGSLIDEWERFAHGLTDEFKGTESESILKKTGRDIFRWAEQVADVRIRDNVSEPYVMRGSYHILANEVVPRVWWHPKYLERLQAILASEVRHT